MIDHLDHLRVVRRLDGAMRRNRHRGRIAEGVVEPAGDHGHALGLVRRVIVLGHRLIARVDGLGVSGRLVRGERGMKELDVAP